MDPELKIKEVDISNDGLPKWLELVTTRWKVENKDKKLIGDYRDVFPRD
jgi:hypothetical protein